MTNQEIDWTKFLPTAPLPVGAAGHLTFSKMPMGTVCASSYCDEGVLRAAVLLRTPETRKTLAGVGYPSSSRVAIIRHADGRWADGYGPNGPIAKPAEPQLLATPWRSCKERPPRIGDVWSHSPEGERFETTTVGADRIVGRCVHGDRLGQDGLWCPASRWKYGELYVWTLRDQTEPAMPTECGKVIDGMAADILCNKPAGHFGNCAWSLERGSMRRADPSRPAKPAPTARELRREEWRRTWKGAVDNSLVRDEGNQPISAVAKLEGIPSGSPLERANEQFRPRFRSSSRYVSPVREVSVGVQGDYPTDNEGRPVK